MALSNHDVLPIPAIYAMENQSEHHILQCWIQRHHNISSNTWSTTISISGNRSTGTHRVCDHPEISIQYTSIRYIIHVQFYSINFWSTISIAVPVTLFFAFYRRLTQFRPKTSAVLRHPASKWASPKWIGGRKWGLSEAILCHTQLDDETTSNKLNDMINWPQICWDQNSKLACESREVDCIQRLPPVFLMNHPGWIGHSLIISHGKSASETNIKFEVVLAVPSTRN